MVFPGSVYIYGHAKTEKVSEYHPRPSCSRKGEIRLRLEDLLIESSRREEVPTVILRFPDFYGPNVTSAITHDVFKAALEGKTARWLGKLDELPRIYLHIRRGKSNGHGVKTSESLRARLQRSGARADRRSRLVKSSVRRSRASTEYDGNV